MRIKNVQIAENTGGTEIPSFSLQKNAQYRAKTGELSENRYKSVNCG